MIIAIAITVSSLSFARGEDGQAIIHEYDLFSNGDDIGDLTVTRKQGQTQNDLIIDSNVLVQVSNIFWNWSMSLDRHYEFNEEGIKSFSHTLVEDGNTSHMKGERQDTFIQAKAGENDFVEIESKYFDATLEGLPRHIMKSDSIVPQTDIRLLDTTTLSIEPYTILEHGHQAITAGGNKYTCRLVKMKTPVGDSTYWIAEDDLGAFVVKESGTDADGPYEVVMKEQKKR